MRTILAQLKQYKKDSILTPLFTALEVIMEVMLPFITALIIDEGIQEGNMRKVYTYGGVMIVMAFISLISGAMAGKYAASASSGLACNLRKGIYDKVQDFSFSNIDKFSTAGLVTRMTTDVTNIQNAYQMCIRVAVRAPLMLVCSMVMSFMISPRLSMIFLGAILFLACILGIIMMAARKIFNVVFTKYDDLNAGGQENVSGIRVVKAYVREDYENQKFTRAAENLCRLFVKAEGTLAFNNPAMMLVVYGCILAVSWFGARFIVIGTMSSGELTSLFSYIMSIMMSLMMLSMIFVMIAMSAASIRRIEEVFKEEPDIRNPERPVMDVADGSVDFNCVCFSYGKGKEDAGGTDKGMDKGRGGQALSDIELHIRSGETVGIIGGTGSGKSSLVNLISRLYDADSGSVCVGGRDVREYEVGKSGCHRRRMPGSLPGGLCRRIHRASTPRIPYLPGAGRNQCVRRSEAEAVYCQGAVKEPQDPDTGRFHQRGGYGDRCQNQGSLWGGNTGNYQNHHCPAHIQRSACGPHTGDRGRAYKRIRNP